MKKYIINTFKRNFGKYDKEKNVIYGLGKNTKLILDEFREFCIKGLIDSLRTREIIRGLLIIICEKAKKMWYPK